MMKAAQRRGRERCEGRCMGICSLEVRIATLPIRKGGHLRNSAILCQISRFVNLGKRMNEFIDCLKRQPQICTERHWVDGRQRCGGRAVVPTRATWGRRPCATCLYGFGLPWFFAGSSGGRL